MNELRHDGDEALREKQKLEVAVLRRRRWIWAVTALVLLASGAAFAWTRAIKGEGRRPELALRGAEVVRIATQLFLDTEDFAGCPSIDDLIAAKRLDRLKAYDPWDRRYRIECGVEGEPHVFSDGADGVAHTNDDIADDMPLARVRALSSRR